ncbi:MAG TPA: guanylate kinase [Planctomycetota bacterium]|nr:guanylate kinase [Planctomycetota bacterium]
MALGTGRIVIVSGPAGVGKTTICEQLLKRPNFVRSISVTTRGPRPNEREGIDYEFWNKVAFEKNRDEGVFLEWAVYDGNYYGTRRGPVEERLRQGKNVICNIEVQGAAQIRKLGLHVISFFLLPPSTEVLRQRIARPGLSPEVIERRMKTAEIEIARAKEYDYQIVNEQIGPTVDTIASLVGQESESREG